MKKVFASLGILYGLLFAQTDATKITQVPPVILSINMYDLNSTNELSTLSTSVTSREKLQEMIENLGKMGTLKLTRSSSIQHQSGKNNEFSSIVPIPYLGDCSFIDNHPATCKGKFAETGFKISILSNVREKDIELFLDLEYLDFKGFSNFKQNGQVFEIPEILQSRQQGNHYLKSGEGLLMVNTKDKEHYHIAIIYAERAQL